MLERSSGQRLQGIYDSKCGGGSLWFQVHGQAGRRAEIGLMGIPDAMNVGRTLLGQFFDDQVMAATSTACLTCIHYSYGRNFVNASGEAAIWLPFTPRRSPAIPSERPG